LVDEISGAFTLAQNFLKHALSDPKYLGDAQVFCEKAKAEKLSDILPRIYRNENPVRQMAALAPFVLDCAERDKNGLAAHVVENYLRKISDESLAIFEKEKLHERRLFSTGGLLKNKYFCTLLEAILKQEKIQFSAVLRSNCYGGLKLSQLGE
jgi:N-acetylglucosamine kinase-like BadF-type ATPase